MSLFPAYAANTVTCEQKATASFPAYGGETSHDAPSVQNKTDDGEDQPDWLRNSSYDPSVAQTERRQGSVEVKVSPPEHERAIQESLEVASERKTDAAVINISPPRASKKKKLKKEHKNKKRKTREDVPRPLYRKFRFLTGFSGEERYFVDPRPDQSQLAFDTLPHTLRAVHHRGWRCDDMPELRRRTGLKTLRYWHRKARQSKCVASAARPRMSASSTRRGPDYIPVQSSCAVDECSTAVDPLGIHDKVTVDYLQGIGGCSNNDSAADAVDASLPLSALLLCPEASQKQKELKERLEVNPASEKAWLDLVAFQDEYVSAMEEASGIARTHGRARAIREKKLAVLEQALLRTHGSVSLHLQKIQVLLECGEEAQAHLAWNELLRVHPGNSRLWLEHARFLQAETTLSGFEFSAASKAYIRAISSFRDMLEGKRGTQRSPREVESRLIEVLFEYCMFLCQCGLWERAVGTYQALLELNLRAPSQLESHLPFDQWLALLEPFWDSGAPRLGEEGSKGWAYALQAKEELLHRPAEGQAKLEERMQNEEDDIINARRSLCETWLQIESLRDLCHWLPFRPDLSGTSEEVTCEDPDRMVLFEDISQALFRLRSMESKFSLLRSFIDLLLGPKSNVSGSGLIQANCFERLPGTDPKSAQQLSDTLAFPAGWEVRRGVLDFAEEVLRQCSGLFDSEQLKWGVGALRIRLAQQATEWGTKRRKKVAKSVLSEHERNLDLWTQYGLLLADLGVPEEAVSVLEKTLDMISMPGVLSLCQGDVWLLVATYLDLLLGVHDWWDSSVNLTFTERSKEKAMRTLSWIESNKRFATVILDNLSPPLLLRAATVCEGMATDVQRTHGQLRVSLWMAYIVSGFEAAAALVNGWVKEAQSKVEGLRCSLEEVHNAYLKVCTFHVRWGGCPSVRPLVSELHRAVADVPHSARLLWLLVSREKGALGALHTRRLLEELEHEHNSPVAWIVGICFELERFRLLSDCLVPEAGFTLPQCGNHVRRVFERALESVSHRRCPLLWRLYIEMEVRYGTRDSAKAIFYRALQSCPWAKVLYIDGVRNFPECLQEVADMLLEKGLRLRAPIEEVQLLLDHTSKDDSQDQQEDSSPAKEDSSVIDGT
ncbi:nuclear exosome regulator NRDE2-like [Ornithodoros turicata]|uniref:nuclear exosome regulator NRDE2-like n=1 Tax=Ornithodoros turicata TaxID=34597 RepID=UPI0031396E08